MQVHCDEGVANHIGPESCVRIREEAGEALTGGVRAGYPAAKMTLFRVPTRFRSRGRQHVTVSLTREAV